MGHPPELHARLGRPQGKLTVFFTAPGKKVGIYKGNPANLPLGNHYQIQLNVGTPDRETGASHQLGQPLIRWTVMPLLSA